MAPKKKPPKNPEKRWNGYIADCAEKMKDKPGKAGVFIIGDVEMPDGKGGTHKVTHIVAPYNEGKFRKDGQKFYTYAKGGVKSDSDKTILEGAIKEVHEETGIDLSRILHTNGTAKGGETVEPYDGVSLVRHNGDSGIREFATVAYPTKSGAPEKLRMYIVEVKGIENLIPHLKGAQYRGENGSTHVQERASITAIQAGLPSEMQLVDVLRTGLLLPTPKCNETWHVLKGPRFTPILPALEGEYRGYLRAQGQDIERGAKIIKTPEDIRSALRACPSFRPVIMDQVKVIRAALEKRGEINDMSGVKLEHTYLPCAWAHEGADILPFEEYVERIAQGAGIEQKPDSEIQPDRDYQEKILQQTGQDKHGNDMTCDSQIRALAPFANGQTKKGGEKTRDVRAGVFLTPEHVAAKQKVRDLIAKVEKKDREIMARIRKEGAGRFGRAA